MDDQGGRPTGVKPRPKPVKDAWKRTNEDMEAIAENRRAEGWEVVSMPAVHTSPVSKSMGDDPERFGLVHIIPDNHADDFTEAYETGEFDEYLAYQEVVHESVFLVTELMDPESETIVLIASHYDRQYAGGMVHSAHEEGVMYTHAKTLDGTELGRFTHEEFEPLLPEPPEGRKTPDPTAVENGAPDDTRGPDGDSTGETDPDDE